MVLRCPPQCLNTSDALSRGTPPAHCPSGSRVPRPPEGMHALEPPAAHHLCPSNRTPRAPARGRSPAPSGRLGCGRELPKRSTRLCGKLSIQTPGAGTPTLGVCLRTSGLCSAGRGSRRGSRALATVWVERSARPARRSRWRRAQLLAVVLTTGFLWQAGQLRSERAAAEASLTVLADLIRDAKPDVRTFESNPAMREAFTTVATHLESWRGGAAAEARLRADLAEAYTKVLRGDLGLAHARRAREHSERSTGVSQLTPVGALTRSVAPSRWTRTRSPRRPNGGSRAERRRPLKRRVAAHARFHCPSLEEPDVPDLARGPKRILPRYPGPCTTARPDRGAILTPCRRRQWRPAGVKPHALMSRIIFGHVLRAGSGRGGGRS